MLPRAEMTPNKFVQKWSQIYQKESAIAQSHFNDVCALIKHPTPLDLDPKGDFFSFETKTVKPGGSKGWVDAWYLGKFIWEYKGAHANLEKAYEQLLLYKDFLGNPPLLVTSDTQKIIVHTNFTNTVQNIHEITFDSLLNTDGVSILERVFNSPKSFEPKITREYVTQATADTFVAVAETLQKWDAASRRKTPSEKIAHFLVRLLFCLFAQDLGLLPDMVFTKLVSYHDNSFDHFYKGLSTLFQTMRNGGLYGYHQIPQFDGTLFDDSYVPELPGDIIQELQQACQKNWANIDPSIFGTLFERVIDQSKRAQIGAHYTSYDDINLVVEPVLMNHLQHEWHETRSECQKQIDAGNTDRANSLLRSFAEHIAEIRVLDPACGSGNFLYVGLRRLLDLQKEVITFAGHNSLPNISLTVTPDQFFGIELNTYAYELAQITIWIGYLQWKKENGFFTLNEPILQPLNNIRRGDAILGYTASHVPYEPSWPEADVIIGNPPFLGSRKMRPVLGDRYCKSLKKVYSPRIKGFPDLVCYWFEKAFHMINNRQVKRVGLLATQAIRGGTNRQVLDKIVAEGQIFYAWSDRNWILDGANVHVSIIGFDNGSEPTKVLDGQNVLTINSDLTTGYDVSSAQSLDENTHIAFQGVVLRGRFDIPANLARQMFSINDNPNGKQNSDVIKLRFIGRDITERPSNTHVIDFGLDMSEEEAQ